jgi:hypothetical protein
MAPVKRVAQIKYSDKRRQATADKALAQVRRKIIHPRVYNEIINDLNAQQVRADTRRANGLARRTAPAPVVAPVVAPVAPVVTSAPNTKRIVTISYSYQYRYKKDKKTVRRTFNGEKHFNIKAGQETTAVVQQWAIREAETLGSASPINFNSDISWSISSEIDVAPAKANKGINLMRQATALALDGRPEQVWDTGKGTCVYDFLIWRYGDLKGCKSICNYESLDFLFKGYSHSLKMLYSPDQEEELKKRTDITFFPGDQPYYMFNHHIGLVDTNPRVDGVSIVQLEAFCEAVGCNMYAMDEKETVINNFKPSRLNKSLPPLIFQIKDNHFYAVTNKNMIISRIGLRKTDVEKANIPKTWAPKVLDIEVREKPTGKTTVEFMVETMKSLGTQVYPFKNIQMTADGLKGFTLQGKRYIFENDTTVATAQEIAEINDLPYTGDTVFTHLYKLLEDNGYTQKSVFNPHMFKLMTTEGIKWRQHYGATEEIRDLSGLLCADITKAYTSVIQKPYDEWLQFGFNDTFVPYKGGSIVPGLYYVKTSDMTLLHSDNIYSHTMVRMAIAEKIPIEIVSVCVPSVKSLPKTYFQKLLDAIGVLCKGEKDLMKVLTNTITGLYGKHQTEKYKCFMNTDVSVVYDDFTAPEFHNNPTFMYRVEGVYVYGYSTTILQAENNIPMYIQILDQANIALYNMIKRSGGTCVWRKTDCALIRGGSLTLAGKGALPGSYRLSDYPDFNEDGILTMEHSAETRGLRLDTVESDWIHYKEITSSSQIDEVYTLLMRTKGLCNVSRAGTGKSYNILGLEERFKKENPDGVVYKIAFTNRACLEVGGTTIHKFLKIDKNGKLNLDWLKSFKNRKVLILIDEVSMIGEFLWRRLVELKIVVPNAYFVLCGDYRQVPPVEQLAKPVDYFECSAMKYLSNYSRIEFIQRQRYDLPLWNFAEKVWEEDTTDYAVVQTENGDDITPEYLDGKNVICYYNETRKSINQLMNEYHSEQVGGEYIFEPFIPSEGKTDSKQQDAYLYVGLPILAHMNKRVEDGEGELMFANNECFTITSIDGTTFTAVSQRPDGDWSITIPIEEFHTYFLLAYCATVHKSQGATIDNDIVIFNYNRMTKNLKYTAITRAKQLTQIVIVL